MSEPTAHSTSMELLVHESGKAAHRCKFTLSNRVEIEAVTVNVIRNEDHLHTSRCRLHVVGKPHRSSGKSFIVDLTANIEYKSEVVLKIFVKNDEEIILSGPMTLILGHSPRRSMILLILGTDTQILL